MKQLFVRLRNDWFLAICQYLNFICVFLPYSDEMLKLGLVFAAVKLRINPSAIVDSEEKVHIAADNILGDYTQVMINCVAISTVSTVQAVAVLMLAFIAFNLRHDVGFEDLLELIEFLFKIRKRATKSKLRILLSSLK